LLPGKHGRTAVPLATVHCVVPDSPGALARMLTDIASAGINVEDLRVDHAPGQAVGTATLAVSPDDAAALLVALRDHGWSATAGSDEAL
jgi:prephenate dehydrogenase